MKNNAFIGVKTTKIYCLPFCPAKTPLPGNIIHFKTALEAESHGFRPCKRCFPDFPYGKWVDKDAAICIPTPREFDFDQCLAFLARSSREPCHAVDRNRLYKLLKIDNYPVLLKIQCFTKKELGIDFLTPRPKKSIRARVAKYVWDWFDLENDLKPFYRLAQKDAVLKHIAEHFYGLRLVIIHDLFEALCWGIIGQHINLEFAYTLKKRFVESYGEQFRFGKRCFYLFPTPQTISRLTVADLRALQFTEKKSQYIIELAGRIKNGALTKEALLSENHFASARKSLMKLRGVGKWTAEYVSLRCLKDPSALPVADVGLQNAIKKQLDLKEKPTVDEILQLAAAWKNWQAYATFYLWHSLI